MAATKRMSVLRRYELPVDRFANEALPLYSDLLENHKKNMDQWKEERDWPKVRLEALKAGRTVSQLRAAVAEMDAVRAGLDAADRHDFDRRLAPHKERALRLVAHHAAIAEWVQAPAIQHDEPPNAAEQQVQCHTSTDQLMAEEIEVERLRAQEETYANLQQDVEDLHDLFAELSHNVHTQAEAVASVEQHVDEAAENVEQGERFLSKAARYKAAVYPLTGALLGTCLAGPIGLLAGLKVGAAAAFGGTVLGFTGGRVLKSLHEKRDEDSGPSLPQSRSHHQGLDGPDLQADTETPPAMKRAATFST